MADRPAKLRRLGEFRRQVPHVSASALASIMKEIDEHGIPELGGRDNIREARDVVTKIHTPYGHVHQTVEVEYTTGAKTHVVYQHLLQCDMLLHLKLSLSRLFFAES